MGFIRDTFFGGAEEKASKRQAAAADRALDITEAAGLRAEARLEPFASTGVGVLDDLSAAAREGPDEDFERSELFREIQNSAAARGKLHSGGTLTALLDRGKALDARFSRQRFNQLFNVASLGSNAAAGQATGILNTAENLSEINIGRGDALAAGLIGKKNAIRGTLFDVGRIIAGI